MTSLSIIPPSIFSSSYSHDMVFSTINHVYLDARKIGHALDGLEGVTCLKFKKVSYLADISIEYTSKQ